MNLTFRLNNQRKSNSSIHMSSILQSRNTIHQEIVSNHADSRTLYDILKEEIEEINKQRNQYDNIHKEPAQVQEPVNNAIETTLVELKEQELVIDAVEVDEPSNEELEFEPELVEPIQEEQVVDPDELVNQDIEVDDEDVDYEDVDDDDEEEENIYIIQKE